MDAVGNIELKSRKSDQYGVSIKNAHVKLQSKLDAGQRFLAIVYNVTPMCHPDL